MSNGLNIAELHLAIEDLRKMATTVNKAHHVGKALVDQLSAVAGELGSLPLGRFWETITTLSQLRSELSLYDPIGGKKGSEHGEDELLRELLPNDPVVYVDVGAGDPAYASNTWRFYCGGGRGLLIEPRITKVIPLLLERPRDCVWPAAVADYEGIVRLFLCDGATSLDPQWSAQKQGQAVAPVHRFQDVLDRFPAIRDACQVCCVDVEGYERRILRAIDWTRFRPQVFLLEYVRFDPFESSAAGDLSLEWKHILEDNGYQEYARTSLNVIYRLRKPGESVPVITPQLTSGPP